MREIKFRAWDKKEKKMYGQQDEFTCDLVILLGGFTKYGGCLDYSSEPCFDDFQWYNRKIVEERYVLMQYTGLKDKNGKEIYDSDILEIADFAMIAKPVRGEVIWFNLSWQVKDGGMLCIFNDDYLEIIGNIHQDPELLEKEQ